MEEVEEEVTPNLIGAREGEIVVSFAPPRRPDHADTNPADGSPGSFVQFGVCHLFASFNDTFIHVTDISGRETICRFTGGMKVKADRDESSPYAAMMCSVDVVNKLKEVGINALHFKLRGTGGTRTRTPGPGGVAALRALARGGIKIGRIEDTTPIPTDTTRKKGGRRGRRL